MIQLANFRREFVVTRLGLGRCHAYFLRWRRGARQMGN
jgi:hypothetical protein